SAKEPGPGISVGPVLMHFTYRESLNVKIPDAYERLLLNAMQGDASLFSRDDEVEWAWHLITPILERWQNPAQRPSIYPAGSWGPAQADALLSADGRKGWTSE